MLRRFPEKREIDKSTRNRDAEPDLKTKEIQPPDTLNSPQFCRGMSQFRSKQTPKLQNKHYITCTFNKTVNRTIHIIHIKVISIEIDPSAHRWCCAFYQVHDQWLISSPWQWCRPQLIAKQHCKISPHLDRQLSYVILVDFRHTAVGESDLPRSHLLRPYSQVGAARHQLESDSGYVSDPLDLVLCDKITEQAADPKEDYPSCGYPLVHLRRIPSERM